MSIRQKRRARVPHQNGLYPVTDACYAPRAFKKHTTTAVTKRKSFQIRTYHIYIYNCSHSLFRALSLSPKSPGMKSSRKVSFFSSSSATIAYTFHNDYSTPSPNSHPTETPIQSSSEAAQIAVTVHLSQQSQSNAAAKIQSAYRAHVIRTLYKKISAVNSEADQLQRLIQRQETVDAIRSDEREKLRMNEALMGLLLRLDSVPGVDLTLREARRKVSRRIVVLQEILDGISEAKVGDGYNNQAWGPPWGYGYDGFMRNWDNVVAAMEEDVCRERGGDEMDRFCAEHLGFRCLQRFLREA